MDILENFFSFIICNEVDLNVVVIQCCSGISDDVGLAYLPGPFNKKNLVVIGLKMLLDI